LEDKIEDKMVDKDEKKFREENINFQKRQIELMEEQQKILKSQTEIQEKQITILSKQNKVIKEQTEFSRILMLATIVLAIGTFLQTIIQVTNIPQGTYEKMINVSGFFGGIIFSIGIVVLLALMGGIIYLIFLAFNKK
jgi:small basic protein